MTPPSEATIPHLLRDAAPQVLGALARRHDNFAAAEDAVQEALMAAATQWAVAGLPTNPRGWLYQVARRRLVDMERSDAARQRREADVGRDALLDAPWQMPADDFGPEHDDSLTLLVMCCHPSLSTASAIALTLRAVGGLTTREIANAFLVPEATMAQRISRAKQQLRQSHARFAIPQGWKRAERITAVMHTLYLIFNEGYSSSEGDALQRPDLANEAIRLTRMLHAVLPGDAEVEGLLALMLLTDARRDARTGPHGELIPLDEQDRTRWHRNSIDEGNALLHHAMQNADLGEYLILAEIASLHSEAARMEDTDWDRIEAFYSILLQVAPSPMASLNHAIAFAMIRGPRAGLALIDRIASEPPLRDHYRVAAVRGHLLEMDGEHLAAVYWYRLAAEGTTSGPERHYLLRKAAVALAVG